MASGLVRFAWWVADGGYMVAAGVEKDGTSVPVLVPKTDGSAHRIDLTENAGAFLAFSEVGVSAADAVAFADTYGLLGHPRTDFHLIEVGDEYHETGEGETLTFWASESGQMRFAVTIWQELHRKRPKPEKLEPLVGWVIEHMAIFSATPEGQPMEALADTDSARVESDWENGRIVPAGRRVLTRLIAFKIAQVGVPLDFVLDANARDVEMVLRPRTLLGALWTQFAEAVTGKIEHRRCAAGCGRWIVIGWNAGGHRTNRTTCSDVCRVRLHRMQPRRRAEKKTRTVKEHEAL